MAEIGEQNMNFFDFLKKALKEYRQKKADEALRKRLVKNTMDYDFMSKLIYSVSNNPDTRIECFLTDGTKIVVRADAKKTHQKKDYELIYEE